MATLPQSLVDARRRNSPATAQAAQCVLAFAVVAAAALTAAGVGAVMGVPVVTWLGLLGLGAVAAGVVWHRAGPLPPSAGPIEPWWYLAGGLAFFVLSTTLVGAASPRHLTANWLNGIGSLPAYPLIVLGLLGLVRGRLSGRDADLLVDGGLAATAFGLGLWIVAVHPGRGLVRHDVALVLLRVMLPALDVALLTLMARLLLLRGEGLRTYRYFGAAIALMLCAHLTAAMAAFGDWQAPLVAQQVLWVCSFGLWGLAALDASMRLLFEPLPGDPPSFSAVHMVAVCGAMLVVPGVVAVEAQRRVAVSATVAAVAVLSAPLLACYVGNLLWDRSRIERRAQHDELTGLPNRTLFLDRLARAVAHARRTRGTVGVLYIDLDRFKHVNDTLGHDAGDRLLVEVAARMVAALRDEDTVARLGGDEFAVLLAHVADADGVVTVAQKLLPVFREPFYFSDEPLVVTPSIGVAVYPQDSQEPLELVTGADAAMYRAKEQGGDAYEIFGTDLQMRASQRLTVEVALRHALEHEEVVVYYQPKVDLRTGRIIGAEALVRWQHPERGLLMPGYFVPVAEQSSLVVALGEYVLCAACEQIRTWQEQGLPVVPISVNVSARQFRSGIVETTSTALRLTGLDPSLLELELTESAAIESLQTTTLALDELKAMGVFCALDDFGTGYCSLKYLSELPITTLKIDKSFVQALSIRDAPIVTAIIGLGHSLGLKIVAEGVETEDQLRSLVLQGCDEIQGYLFSPAVPAEEFARMLVENVVQGPGTVPLMRAPDSEPELRTLESLVTLR